MPLTVQGTDRALVMLHELEGEMFGSEGFAGSGPAFRSRAASHSQLRTQ